MLKMWQNYVDQYNKFQWWLSGLIYGLYIGALYQQVKGIRNLWSQELEDKLSWKDSFLFVFAVKYEGMETEGEMITYLQKRGYRFIDPMIQNLHCVSCYGHGEQSGCPHCGKVLT